MKAFVDTNVLVYAATMEDERKQAQAQALLVRGDLQPVTVSTQVLSETYNVLTLRKRWAASEALAAVRVLATLRVFTPSRDTVMRGLELAARHQLSAWDALIVQAAIESDCDTLFSEDLQAGRRYGGLEIVNPFDLSAHEAKLAPAAPLAAKPKAPRAPGKPRKAVVSATARR